MGVINIVMLNEILTKEFDIPLKDICISVDIGDMVYPLSFIRCETDEYLVIDSTGDDGCERLVIVNKDKILSVNVVYEQDMFPKKKEDKMFR